MEKKLAEGRTKDVYLSDNGYVSKTLNIAKDLDYNSLMQDILLKQKYLGKYIPETFLEKKLDGSYYIKQKYINGKRLKDLDLESLGPFETKALIDLIEVYIAYCKGENKIPDFIGFQGIRNKYLTRLNTLLHLYQNILKSSNIMFSQEEGRFYWVDIVEPQDKKNILMRTISQSILLIFVKFTLKRLKRKIRKDIQINLSI